MPQSFVKDPNAVLDYTFDWSDWLATGDTISTRSVTADSGITVDSSAIIASSTAVQVWLSSGTAGKRYDVTCRITTAGGRTDDRTIAIEVENR